MIGNKLYFDRTSTHYVITVLHLYTSVTSLWSICSEHHDQLGKMNTNTEVMRLDDIDIGS